MLFLVSKLKRKQVEYHSSRVISNILYDRHYNNIIVSYAERPSQIIFDQLRYEHKLKNSIHINCFYHYSRLRTTPKYIPRLIFNLKLIITTPYANEDIHTPKT